MCVLCFAPEGGLVVGDVMLAQKLALELFESDTLKVANRLSPDPYPLGLLPSTGSPPDRPSPLAPARR